jgi:hypothetical protein
MSKSTPKHPGWKAKLLLGLAAFAFAMLVAEVALRIIGFTNLNPYITDRYTGFSLRPNTEGWWHGEGTTYIRTNSDGLRDREHTKAKPPNTIRIAVLGDSFTEAFDVDMPDAWWAVMEKRLQGCGAFAGNQVEVINFGVSGYSTARELMTLKHRVWDYSPDIVVLNMTLINDIKDNSKVLNPQYASLPLPYYIYEGDQLVLDDAQLVARNNSTYFRLQQSFPGRVMNSLRNLRLMQLIDKARISYSQGQIFKRQQAEHPNAHREVAGWDSSVLEEPTKPDWIEAWRVTEGTLLLMRDEVSSKGAKFLLVTGSSGIQVHPDPVVRQESMRRLKLNDLFYPDKRIRAFGERENITVLNLAQPMQKYAESNKLILHGQGDMATYGHWNQAGNKIAGELIAAKLCSDFDTIH